MKIVSIILARGGSKGIPNKNIIDICGKPMIYYSIHASQSANIDSTYVSTDSKQIAMISEKYGAKIIKRPKIYQPIPLLVKKRYHIFVKM